MFRRLIFPPESKMFRRLIFAPEEQNVYSHVIIQFLAP
jgi:hypothetical protein